MQSQFLILPVRTDELPDCSTPRHYGITNFLIAKNIIVLSFGNVKFLAKLITLAS